MLVVPFGMLVCPVCTSVCGWAGASLVVKVLGCELGTLVCPFSALVCPFAVSASALGTLVSAFAVSVCG